MSPTRDWAFTDTVTWLKGSHTVKSGLLYIYNTKKQNGRSNYAGTVAYNPTGNPNATGNAFADALLGNFRTYSEAQLDPLGYFRFHQVEAFATDDWRIGRNLSIEVGLRYTYHYPTYTEGNNLTAFDPAHYDPAQAVTVNTNGTLVPGTRQPLQRPDPPRRGAGRPEGPGPERGQPGGAGDPDRGPARDLQPAAPLHAALQLRVVARRRRQDVGARRHRPLLRPAGGQPVLRPAEQPALRAELVLREREHREPRRRAVPALAPWGNMQSVSTGFEMPGPVELELEPAARAAVVGPLRRDRVRGRRRLQPDAAAGHQPAVLRGPRGERGRAALQHELPPALQGLREHRDGPERRKLQLQRAAGVPEQAARRPELHAQLHARPGRRQRERELRQPGGRPRGHRLLLGPERLRPHAHLRGDLELLVALLQEQPGLLGNLLGGWQVSGITRYQTGAPITDHSATPRSAAGEPTTRAATSTWTSGSTRRTASCSGSTPRRSRRRPRAVAATASAARSAGRRTTSGTSRSARSSGSPATCGCRSRPTSSTPSTASTGATRTTARPNLSARRLRHHHVHHGTAAQHPARRPHHVLAFACGRGGPPAPAVFVCRWGASSE